MLPEQSTMLLNILLPAIEEEAKTTTRVISAVPLDKGDYTPCAPSKTALELAWHIASSDIWFLDSVAKGEFAMGEGEDAMPAEIKNSADVAAWYQEKLPGAVQAVRALSGEQLSKAVDFFGAYQLPAVCYLDFMIRHTVHHRGQLTAYLRPMGAKVPSIYGGSFDEPWVPAAESATSA